MITKPKEAIILAGGKGTRLQSVVSDIPKSMALINNVPFLTYMLNYLEKYGIEHIILSVGYKWNAIFDHFGDQYNSIRLSYAIEKEPLGTGGGIKLAMEKVEGKDVCKVTGFKEKQPLKSGLINGGVYIMKKHLFESFSMPEKFSFETDFMEKNLSDLKICAMRCNEYFIDIGIPADYEKANKDLPARIIV